MEQMKVVNILEITINNLNNIRVPAALLEEIGIPIVQNVNNLYECVNALKAEGDENKSDPPVEGIFGDEQTKE